MKRRSFLGVFGGAALAGMGARALGGQQLAHQPSTSAQAAPAGATTAGGAVDAFGADGSRLVMDKAGVRIYDPRGVLRVQMGHFD